MKIVQYLAKIFFLFCLFVGSFLLFLPNQALFNLAQKELQHYNVHLLVHDDTTDVYYFDTKVAKIQDLKINISGIYMKNITGYGSLASVIPPIKTLTIMPKLHHFITLESNSGSVWGDCHLFQREVVIYMKISSSLMQQYKQTLGNLQKKGDVYVYKLSF